MAKYGGLLAVLAVDSAGGDTFSNVGQIRDVKAPGLGRDSIDVATRDDMDRDGLKGLKNGGELTFDVLFAPELDSHSYADGILSDLADDSVNPKWRLTFPDSDETTFTFFGIVTGFDFEMSYTDALTANVSVQVSGDVIVNLWYFDSGLFFDDGLNFK